MRVDSSEDWDHVHVKDFAQLLADLISLLAELSGRSEDQCYWTFIALQSRLFEHVSQQWNEEGICFTGASFSDTHQISSLECARYGLSLYRSRLNDAVFDGKPFEHTLVDHLVQKLVKLDDRL